MHELGHAFNAPHDRQWASQDVWSNGSIPNYKMSMMRLSYYFLWVRPCFITDAAIFNSCEVFSNNNKTYYDDVTASVTSFNASYSAATGSIIVSGRFSSTGTVTNIL